MMIASSGPDGSLWIEALASLALGVGAAVALAVLAARWARSARRRRTIWQACITVLLALTVLELGGVAPAVVQGLRGRRGDSARIVSAPSSAEEDPAGSDGSEHEPVITPLAPLPSAEVLDLTAPADPPSSEELREVGADAVLVPAPHRRAVERDSIATRTVEPVGISEAAATGAPTGFWWPGALWLVGASLICGRSLFARLLLARTRRRLDDASPELEGRTRALAERLGLRARVVLKQSEGLGVPLTFGLFRPVVVLPPRFDTEYTEAEQDVVLAHELAHVASGDAFWQLISECACALLWWHPLSWYARQRLQAESEFAADEATTLIDRGPETLAGCLVDLAARLSRAPRLGLLSIRGRGFRSGLGRRVERLVRLEGSARPPRPGHGTKDRAGRFAALACSLAVVATITLATAWARTPRSQTGDLDMDPTTTPGAWRRSLAGFVFASFFSLSGGETFAEDAPTEVGVSADVADAKDEDPKEESKTPAARRTPAPEQEKPETANPPPPPVPRRPTVSASRPVQSAPRPTALAGPTLSTDGAIHDRGTGLFLDLVNLATALTDAQGEVELQRLDYGRFADMSGQNLVSETEILKAKILLETAERKADILQRMAEAALNSSVRLLEQLHVEYEIEKQRFQAGTASHAALASVSTRLAAAEGNVEILKTLLSKPRSTSRRSTSKRRTSPTSFRIGLMSTGMLTLDGRSTDVAALHPTLDAAVPRENRPRCEIRIAVEAKCPIEKITRVLDVLSSLGYTNVELTSLSAPAKRAPGGSFR